MNAAPGQDDFYSPPGLRPGLRAKRAKKTRRPPGSRVRKTLLPLFIELLRKADNRKFEQKSRVNRYYNLKKNPSGITIRRGIKAYFARKPLVDKSAPLHDIWEMQLIHWQKRG